MKKAFFALVFVSIVFLFSSANALEIVAPESVPANVDWSVSITLEDVDFDSIALFLDGKQVLELEAYRVAFKDESRVIEHVLGNKQLFVSLRGVEKGSHVLEAKTRENSSVKESEEWEFSAFEATSAETAEQAFEALDEIKADVEVLKNSGKELKSSFDEFSSSLSGLNELVASLENALSGNGAEISSLKSTVSALSSDLSALNSRLAETEEIDEETRASINSLSERVNALDMQLNPPLLEEKQSVDAAGLVSFVTAPENIPAIGLIVAVIVIVIIILLVRRRSESPLFEDSGETFGSGEDEGAVFEAGEAEPEPESEGSDEEIFQGKWAFKGEEGSVPEKKGGRRKKVNFSELLWKKR